MLQIIDLENKELLTQISSEEAAVISGAGRISGAFTSIVAIGGAAFGDPNVQAGILATTLNPTLN